MKLYLETTAWKDSTPNHTYALSDDRRSMVAYIKQGTTDIKVFSKPLPFDPRYRTFKIMGDYMESNREFSQYIGHGDYQTVKEYKVAGSKGAEYTVTISEVSGDSCTCPGFLYHSTCKHIKSLQLSK